MPLSRAWESGIGRGYCERASYACLPELSRGRLIEEPASRTRSCYQRDRDRVIHSTAFRRLKHKTQVFVAHEGDHYRTRLTHTIEVSQIARAIARALRLDEELAEAIALAHDFGHTPFGHTGEEALNACMEPHGGFEHNAQSLRIVTLLESRYSRFDGLNLSWETLEGLVKHNGPLTGPDGAQKTGDIPQYIVEYTAAHGIPLSGFAGLEAQAAAIADDIAYDTHDIDDGLRAHLFTLDDLRAVPFAGEMIEEIENLDPGLEPVRIAHELTRRQITAMVEDVIDSALAKLAHFQPETVEDIRRCPRQIVCFSQDMQIRERELKAFLFRRMYRHDDVLQKRKLAEKVITELFQAYMGSPAEMRVPRRIQTDRPADPLPRQICDYIAGMTDNFALDEHRRMFDGGRELG